MFPAFGGICNAAAFCANCKTARIANATNKLGGNAIAA
jgi:hypothetical protein